MGLGTLLCAARRRTAGGASYVKGANMRSLGLNIGTYTSGGGLSVAFDGTTNEGGCFVAAATEAYIGKDLSSAAKRVFEAVCFGGNGDGYVNGAAGTPTVTLTLRGKNGGAPSSASDGTDIGSINFTDTSNESTGRTITSTDNVTQWDYIWVQASHTGSATWMYFAECELYEAVPA